MECPLCGSSQTESYCKIDHSVASDASQIPLPAHTYFCRSCINFFKKREEHDYSTIRKIYNSYTLHNIGDSTEHRVAYDQFPDGIEKSKYLLLFLLKNVALQTSGKILDFGCHFGSLLNFFHKEKKDWDIAGYDISERFRDRIEGISSTATYFCSSRNNITDRFDLITMTHVLEHSEDPTDTLQFVQEHLRKEGLFFLQCNNAPENPFLPFLFEQHFNFSVPGLFFLFDMVGLSIVKIQKNWISKEISIIAKRTSSRNERSSITASDTVQAILSNRQLLNQMSDALLQLRKKGTKIGVFGTAYAAKWIGKDLKDNLRFFVDENPLMQGKTLLSVPVLKPEEIPPSSLTIVALPPKVAQVVIDRLQPNVKGTLVPPPFIH